MLHLCEANSSINGGIYMPKRPLKFFFSPYQPPIGLSDERARKLDRTFFRLLFFIFAAQFHPIAMLL